MTVKDFEKKYCAIVIRRFGNWFVYMQNNFLLYVCLGEYCTVWGSVYVINKKLYIPNDRDIHIPKRVKDYIEKITK